MPEPPSVIKSPLGGSRRGQRGGRGQPGRPRGRVGTGYAADDERGQHAADQAQRRHRHRPVLDAGVDGGDQRPEQDPGDVAGTLTLIPAAIPEPLISTRPSANRPVSTATIRMLVPSTTWTP
jgi:hypothetical protein